MGITERKEREKADMRRRIVDAAIQMFVHEGYEKVSIRNIAERIEYSPATIYLYYKDKDELLYDVQREAFTTLADTFRAKVTNKDPLERLEQLMHTYIQFSQDHPELYDLMFIIKAPMNTSDAIKEWKNGESAFNYLKDTVEECVAAGLLRYKDPQIATYSVWAHSHGFISLNVRCRMKIANISEEEMNAFIMQAMREFLQLIKA